MILPWPDFETLRDNAAAEEEVDENLGDYQNRSEKWIFEWIVAFLWHWPTKWLHIVVMGEAHAAFS